MQRTEVSTLRQAKFVLSGWRALVVFSLTVLLGMAPLLGGFHSAHAQVCSDTVNVTSTADSGSGSLREAMVNVCENGVITFTGIVVGSTITLTNSLNFVKHMTLQGPGADALTISGNDAVGIFYVPSYQIPVRVTIDGMTLSRGLSYSSGGAISNSGNMTVTNSVLTDNRVVLTSAPTHGGAINNGINGTFVLSNSVVSNNSIAGSSFMTGNGGAINNLGTMTIISTTLDGNYNSTPNSSGGAVWSEGPLTIVNSQILANTSLGNGGGIYSIAPLTIIGTTIDGNATSNDAAHGAGLYNAGTVSMTTSTVSNNFTDSGDSRGGGISNDGLMTIVDSEILSNTATSDGGGISSSGTITVIESTISDNYSTGSPGKGGGISNSGTATVIESTISDNLLTGQFGSGAGISNAGQATLEIVDSIIQENQAPATNNVGGGLINNGELTIDRSFVVGNLASMGGGGIYNTSIMTMTNTTLDHNMTNDQHGGAIYLNASSLSMLLNNSFANNSAPLGMGSALYSSSANATLSNNLFVTTTVEADTGDQCSGRGNYDSNLSADGSCGQPGVSVDNLQVGPLGTYGGKVPVLPLMLTNIAINGVLDSNSCPATDARGIARPQGVRCDVGAFESTPFTLSIENGNNQSALIGHAFAQPLMVRVSNAYSEPTEGIPLIFVDPSEEHSITVTAGITPTFQIVNVTSDVASFTPVANSYTGVYSVVVVLMGLYDNYVIFDLENVTIDTATGLTSAPNPAIYSQDIVFTATVSAIDVGSVGAAGNSEFGGSVEFRVNGDEYATVPLDENNVATTEAWQWEAGEYTVTARYLGQGYYDGSTSEVLTQVVNPDSSSVALTSSINPIEIEEIVTFTATVSGGTASYALGDEMGTLIQNSPSGTVEFYDGSTWLGSGTIDKYGVALFATHTLAAGEHQMTAVYGGNTNYLGSTSTLYVQSVYKHATATLIEASTASATVGDSYQVTATVSSDYVMDSNSVAAQLQVTPLDGVVRIYRNGSLVTEQEIDANGQFVIWVGGIVPAGTYGYSAAYQGNSHYAASQSNVATIVIAKANSSVALASSTPTTLLGDVVSFTATLTSDILVDMGGNLDAQVQINPVSGKVVFKAGAAILGEVELDGDGKATLTTSALSVGNHTITAVYAGNEYLNGSTSGNLSHSVQTLPVAPQAANDAVGTLEGNVVSVAPLDNDTSGSQTTLNLQSVGQPSNGSAEMMGNEILYTPNAGFSGMDTFTYVVVDGNALSASALVAVVVSQQSTSGQAPQIAVIDNGVVGSVQFTSDALNVHVDVPSGVYTGTLTNQDIFYLALTWLIEPSAGDTGNLQFATVSFDLSAYLNGSKLEGFVFGSPVTMTINYGAAAMGELSPATAQLLFLDGATWSSGGIEFVSHDTENRNFVARISHLSEFALFGSSPTGLEEVDQPVIQVYMPQVGR